MKSRAAGGLCHAWLRSPPLAARSCGRQHAPDILAIRVTSGLDLEDASEVLLIIIVDDALGLLDCVGRDRPKLGEELGEALFAFRLGQWR